MRATRFLDEFNLIGEIRWLFDNYSTLYFLKHARYISSGLVKVSRMNDLASPATQRTVALVTLRAPVPPRYSKMLSSLSKMFRTTLITGTVVPTMHLTMDFGTVFSYGNLFTKLLHNKKPTIIDVNALASARLTLKKNMAVDFRTPLSYELKWLGHHSLSSFARIIETALKDVALVTTTNELMAGYCGQLGAQNIHVIPNYPTKDFAPSIKAENWKTEHSLSPNEHVVLFSGGVRLREIYGLNLLLESWKIVEDSRDDCTLVILGDDSVDYTKILSRSLGIERLFLPGRVGMKVVANWINCADLCVAPRTPGFSNVFYNDKDSNKISEYAALKKPIVATSYAPSDQYLLVDPNPAAFAEGIMKGLDGTLRAAQPHFWEENESRLLRLLERFWY